MNSLRGIDHIGLTVPNLDEATKFLVEAFDAVVLYDTYTLDQPPRNSEFTHKRLGIADSMAQRAIRTVALPFGPGIELFQYEGPDQREAVTPADIGWQHIAFYVDNMNEALAKVEAAGGKRNSDPVPLSGIEGGDGNYFCYCRTPWGSSIELITYPTPQPYLETAPRAKWHV